MPNSDTKFTASNYGLETTAKHEWEIVTSGAYTKSCTDSYTETSARHDRKLRKLE